MNKRDLTSDSIPKLFATLAIPTSVGFFFNTMYNVTDTYFAGLLGTSEIAALSISFPVFFIILALGVGMSQGTTALIANFLGEKNHGDANTYVSQSLAFSFFVSIFSTIVGLLVSPLLFGILGAEGNYLKAALDYINVIFLGSFTFFITFALSGILNAYGDTKSYRNVLIAGFLLNFIFNPVLMFGLGPIPKLGIAGIALGTIFVEFIGMIYLLFRVINIGALVHCSFKDYLPKKKVFLGIFKQGYPPSLNMFTVAAGIFIITYFLAIFGKEAVAAYGISTRIEQIFLLPSIGINTATLTLIGHNNGAKKFDRVKEVYKRALRYGFYIALISGPIIFTTGGFLVSLFTDDQTVIDISSTYLKIASFLVFFYIILFCTSSALQGLKKPIYALWAGLVRQIIAPVILFTLSIHVFHLGLMSIWVSIAITVVFGGLLMYYIGRYQLGKLE